jgi:hypothetical protein
LNKTGSEIVVETSARWWRRRWLMWVGGGFVLAAVVGAGVVEWVLRQVQPMLRKKVIATMSARFNSPVELDRLELSMHKHIIVTGGGLRILYLAGPTRPDAHPAAGRPMLTVQSFEFRTGWRELLRPTTRVVSVKVRGLQVNIPPKQERGPATPDDARRRGQPKLGIAVDTIECTDAQVVVETREPGKVPLAFDIASLTLTDVGARKPLNYTAVLTNPKPVGEVRSTGHFGPWQSDNPRDTPIDGSFEFTNADLSSIRGIGGVLAATGRFGGMLGEIAVDGVVEVPRFRLDISDHALPLHAEFHAVVDGTTGDTRLDPVRARLGRSEFTARGAVTRGVGAKGHAVDLDVVMEKGRVEDMLTIALKANPSLMRGAMTARARIELPPGPVSVSQKVRLTGTFAIHDAILNDAKMQEQVDSLSMRAQGKPKQANAKDAKVVGSSLSGRFAQADAVMTVDEVDYQMPGAQMAMNGKIQMVGSTFEFHGKVRTQATASQMTTGWKSMLLRPLDPLLKKNGAGLEVPIKVTGTRSTYDLRLDFPHDTRAKPGVDARPK